MPGELALPSLEIHNFRGLRELKIARLGRANLIVGKNNVGKTSVLEAIRLYSAPGSPEVLLELLEQRDEWDLSSFQSRPSHLTVRVPYERLFHGWVAKLNDDSIQIGPVDRPGRTLTIAPALLHPPSVSNGLSVSDLINGIEDVHTVLTFRCGTSVLNVPVANVVRFLEYREDVEPFLNREYGHRASHACFVGPNGLQADRIGPFWDDISLTDSEDDVSLALRLLVPAIDRVNLRPVGESSSLRVPFVRVKGFSGPVPLKSMGDGVNRLFGLILALVTAKDGFLLVDEIENGLHYTIQADVWRFIFQVATSLNVQVFATTHSSDCVEAFQAAASESEEDGVLIRLARKGDRILVGEYDEALLEKAVDGGVEVR